MFHNAELQFSNEVLQNLTLLEIEKLLQLNRSTLKIFSSILIPNGFVNAYSGNRLIYAELDYNIKEERNLFLSNLNLMTSKLFICLFLPY